MTDHPRPTLRVFGIATAILLMILGGYLLLGSIGARAPARWDLSVPWSLSEFHTQNAMRFAHEVADVTDGRVQITVHPGAILGIKGPDSLRAVSDGVVTMADMAGFQQVGSEPILGLEALPFLVDDQAELRHLYSFLRPAVEAAFARHGLKVLYIVPWPNQNLYTDRTEDSLEAFAGTKVRTLDANTTELMDRLGFTPVQLPAPDVVPALASGAISATMTSTTTGVAQKYWEFLSTIYRTNHNWASNMVVVNMDSWRDLSARDRAAIEALTARLEPEFWAISKADDARQLAVLRRNGMEVVVPDAQMAATMRAVARPMWREFVARNGPVAKRILTDYLASTGREPLSPNDGETR